MQPLFMLAQTQLPDLSNPWAPIILMIVIAIGFTVSNIVLSVIIGPSRTGPGKETTYESGMTPIGDARKRFNVRFYVVAMIFLVFDVEIVFFYPFATIFGYSVRGDAQHPAGGADSTTILISMLLFVAILLVSYIYAWGKGVFRWD